MRLSIKVKIRAKKEGIKESGQGGLIVSVAEAPEKGKANERIIKLLAEYFGIAKSNIEIVSGRACRTKIVEIKKAGV